MSEPTGTGYPLPPRHGSVPVTDATTCADCTRGLRRHVHGILAVLAVLTAVVALMLTASYRIASHDHHAPASPVPASPVSNVHALTGPTLDVSNVQAMHDRYHTDRYGMFVTHFDHPITWVMGEAMDAPNSGTGGEIVSCWPRVPFDSYATTTAVRCVVYTALTPDLIYTASDSYVWVTLLGITQ